MAITADKYKKQNFGVYVDSEGAIGSPGTVYLVDTAANAVAYFGTDSIELSYLKAISSNSKAGAIFGSSNNKGAVGTSSRVIDAFDLEWAPYKVQLGTGIKCLKSTGDLIDALNYIYEYYNEPTTFWGPNLGAVDPSSIT